MTTLTVRFSTGCTRHCTHINTALTQLYVYYIIINLTVVAAVLTARESVIAHNNNINNNNNCDATSDPPRTFGVARGNAFFNRYNISKLNTGNIIHQVGNSSSSSSSYASVI